MYGIFIYARYKEKKIPVPQPHNLTSSMTTLIKMGHVWDTEEYPIQNATFPATISLIIL